MQRVYNAAIQFGEAKWATDHPEYKRTRESHAALKETIKNRSEVYGKNARLADKTYEAGSPAPHPWHYMLHIARRNLGDGRTIQEYADFAKSRKALLQGDYDRLWPNAPKNGSGGVKITDRVTKQMARQIIATWCSQEGLPAGAVKLSSDMYIMLRRMEMDIAKRALRPVDRHGAALEGNFSQGRRNHSGELQALSQGS
jgi:hypothetical protein